MEFGYFTLSDNRYPDNPRGAGDFMMEIRDQSVYAEQIGMNSAWIGEHHFNRRGCVPMPGLVHANIAALTNRIRLGPAVVVLPIHHPVQVAEEWASLDQLSGGRVDFACGRGYDMHEYEPFDVDYQKSAEIFDEGLELLTLCWNEDGPVTFEGKHYRETNLEVCPKPVQKPFRPYMGSFSKFSMQLAARHDWNLMLAPFAASLVFGGLDQAIDAYRDICVKADRPVRGVKISYFIHICEEPQNEYFAAEGLIDYFTMSGLRSKSTPGGKLPPTMAYYQKIREALADLKKEDLGEHSILVGSPQRIIDRLKEVEALGVEEVMLYFNYARKPDALVREQMDRFMKDVAPAFDGSHFAIQAAQ